MAALPEKETGGNISINQCIIDVGTNNFVINLIDIAKVHITSTGFAGAKFAVGLQNISEKFIMSNCYNLNSDVPLTLRYTTTSGGSPVVSSAGDVPNIEWLFDDNVGINSGFVYSQAQLASSTAVINAVGKSQGKIVLGYDVNKQLRYYYATGEKATAPWAMLESTTSVTPA